MSEETPKPSKFALVEGGAPTLAGGTRPLATEAQMRNSGFTVDDVGETDFEHSGEKTYTQKDLFRIYSKVVRDAPSGFFASCNPDDVAKERIKVIGWNIGALLGHLELPNSWAKPALTKAVLDEIKARLE